MNKHVFHRAYLSNGSLFQKGLCDCLKLLMKRGLGKFDVVSLLTFNRWVIARTRDKRVEKRFSAVNNSKPSSSSSSPELPDSLGSWLKTVERLVGRELLLNEKFKPWAEHLRGSTLIIERTSNGAWSGISALPYHFHGQLRCVGEAWGRR